MNQSDNNSVTIVTDDNLQQAIQSNWKTLTKYLKLFIRWKRGKIPCFFENSHSNIQSMSVRNLVHL